MYLIHSRRSYNQVVSFEAEQTVSTVSDALTNKTLISRNANENMALLLFIQHRLQINNER